MKSLCALITAWLNDCVRLKRSICERVLRKVLCSVLRILHYIRSYLFYFDLICRFEIALVTVHLNRVFCTCLLVLVTPTHSLSVSVPCHYNIGTRERLYSVLSYFITRSICILNNNNNNQLSNTYSFAYLTVVRRSHNCVC